MMETVIFIKKEPDSEIEMEDGVPESVETPKTELPDVEQVLIKIEPNIEDDYVEGRTDAELRIKQEISPENGTPDNFVSISGIPKQEYRYSIDPLVGLHTTEEEGYPGFCDTWDAENERDPPNSFINPQERNTYANEALTCQICLETFSSESNLEIHSRSHTLQQLHKCSTCSKTFEQPHALALHKCANEEEESFEYMCEQKFTEIGGLRLHEEHNTSTDTNVEKTDTNIKLSDKKAGKSRRGRKRLPKKGHKCDVCGKEFLRASNLNRHKRTHTGVKPFECEICNTKFAEFNTLKRHMHIHTGDKPHVCPVCNQAFAHMYRLNIHKRFHDDQRRYVCEICNKGYNQLCNYQAHMRTHTGERPFVCDICNESFSKTRHLCVHKRIHSGNEYVCEVCKKTFLEINKFNRHKLTHSDDKPYGCDICEKKFVELNKLVRHRRIHLGLKPFTCEVCQRKFNQMDHLKTHMRTHTGEKFGCDICMKSFSTVYYLNVHKGVHSGEGKELKKKKSSLKAAVELSVTP